MDVMNYLAGYLSVLIRFMEESRIIGALLILLGFAVLAKLADLIIHRLIRSICTRTKIEIDDTIVGILHRPVWITILLLGALSAVRWIDPQPQMTFFLSAALKTVLLLIAALTVNKLLTVLCDWWCSVRSQLAEIIRLFENLGRVVLLVGGIALLLSLWQVNVGPLLASAGIAGAAVALAAKDTIANFFGGINVFMDKPFKTGDFIVLDSGERGEVIDIGVRSTRIMTRDDVQVSIPNSVIANTKIINESAPEPRFRVRIQVGVAYGSDVDEVEETLLGVARANQSISPAMAPRVRFRRFGDSSLDFELLCWVKVPVHRGRVIHELNRDVYKEFTRRNILIPFPQRDVYIHTLPQVSDHLQKKP